MPIGWSSLARRRHWAQVTSIHRPYIRASPLAECRPRAADPRPVGEIFPAICYVRVCDLNATVAEIPAFPCLTPPLLTNLQLHHRNEVKAPPVLKKILGLCFIENASCLLAPGILSKRLKRWIRSSSSRFRN